MKNPYCLKLPLKKDILIFLSGEILLCQIIFAGKDTLKLKNVKKRILQNETFFDYVIANEIILDRSKVLGYSYDVTPPNNLNICKNYTEIITNPNTCNIINLRRKKDARQITRKSI